MTNGVTISQVKRAIEELGRAPKALDAALKRAARLWATQTVKVARTKVPTRRTFYILHGKKYPTLGASQALKKSLGSKAKKSKKTGQIYGVVGPRRKKHIQGVNPRTGQLVTIKPTRYAHLVEKGFLAKLWKSGKRVRVPGRPFLVPAYDATKSEALSLTGKSVREALNKLNAPPLQEAL